MPTTYVNGSRLATTSERITSWGTAKGLTATKYDFEVTLNGNIEVRRAEEIYISVETGAIRWTVDGTTPTTTATTSIGHVANIGDTLVIAGYQNIKNFKAINEVAANNAALYVTYFKG